MSTLYGGDIDDVLLRHRRCLETPKKLRLGDTFLHVVS